MSVQYPRCRGIFSEKSSQRKPNKLYEANRLVRRRSYIVKWSSKVLNLIGALKIGAATSSDVTSGKCETSGVFISLLLRSFGGAPSPSKVSTSQS